MSDAVLFVPEGLAVVRIAEVVRQSGVVTASPEGAWTIAPESGPEPGPPALRRGLDPARRAHAGRHGHRHEAAPGRPRARPDRPADRPRRGRHGAASPPTATSARVTRSRRSTRARCCSASPGPAATPASTTPGSGRRPTSVPRWRRWAWRGAGPSVEELNGEGFPYSPYVLRRADLLTPAAMAAASASAASQAPAPAPAAPPLVGRVRGSPARPGAAGSGGHRPGGRRVRGRRAAAQAPPRRPRRTAGRRPVQRDTVAIDATGRRTRASAACSPVPSPRMPGAADPSRARRRCSPPSGPPPRTSVFAAPSPAAGAAAEQRRRVLERVRPQPPTRTRRTNGRAEPPRSAPRC